MHARVMEITGADPLPYGIAPNRAMIEQLIRHTVSQRPLEGRCLCPAIRRHVRSVALVVSRERRWVRLGSGVSLVAAAIAMRILCFFRCAP